tara:strand:- start:299 stop:2884 length:2586 start_codon:yes stop_codon:yes gene_type:complete
MVDKIDPTNQTSVEYGQSLLERKYQKEAEFAEGARKDRKINYAMQVLGGVDSLIKDRARRNMEERNNELTQQIIREEAEFNKLQKEYNDQAAWRESNDPYAYATKKAKEDLAEVWKLRLNEGLYGDVEKEYQNSVIALADNYYNKYQENKISALPFETKEEYTAELRAMLNKQAPSGLLDIALRGVGFRGNKQEELATKIGDVQDTYKDSLRDRPGVKGEAVELSDEAKLALIQSPKQPSSKVSEIKVKGKDTTVNRITDPETGEVTYTDIFGKKLTELDDLNIPLTRDEINRKLVDITKRYNARYGQSQTATIHSAIDNPNSPYYDLRLADELRLNGLFINTFNVDTKSLTLKGQIKDDISTIDKEGQFNNEKILEKQTTLKNRYALTYQLLKNGGTQEMYDNFLTRVADDAIRIQQRGIVNENGILQPVEEAEALRLSHQHHAAQGITKQSKSAGLLGRKTEEFYVYNYQPLNINQFDSEVPVQINRDKEGKPDSPEQINRDTEEVINSEEFQSKTPKEQKAILQNAKEQGADINPEILGPPRPTIDEVDAGLKRPRDDSLRPDGTKKDPTGFLGPIRNNVTGEVMSEVSMGIGPKDNQTLIPLLVPTLTEEEIETLQNMELEGNVDNIPQSIKDKAIRHAQEREEKGLSPFYGSDDFLPLTGDDSFDANRTADEMLLADEGPTVQEAQEYLDREKEMLSPDRPEFRELTREELTQQRQEKAEADTLRRKEKAEADTLRRQEERDARLSDEDKTRLTKEKEIKDNIKESVKTFLNNDPEMNRIKMYADGTLNKNSKPKANTSLGKALAKYGLENMSREEIKEWLADRIIKTAYSPSDVRAELDKGNPVFVGDYRDVTGG